MRAALRDELAATRAQLDRELARVEAAAGAAAAWRARQEARLSELRAGKISVSELLLALRALSGDSAAAQRTAATFRALCERGRDR